MSDMKRNREAILEAMYDYVDLGLPVIPLCAHDHAGYSERHVTSCRAAGKIPIIKGWREHKETTTQHVRNWIREFKNINIGLPLGSVSGYVGIDVDGDLGYELLQSMSKGDLPMTWEYTTSAGHRLLYTIPVGMATKKSVNLAEGEHEECSILCEGQQTVMPPSIHNSGHIYTWVEGRSPEDIDCAPAPEWLIDMIQLDKKSGPGSGTIDLTQVGNVQAPASDALRREVHPILVTQETIAAEFADFHNIEVDLVPPDSEYAGKAAKTQEEKDNGVTEEELMSIITEGNRDNQMTRIIGSFCARYRSLGKDYIMLMAKNHNQMFCQPPLDTLSIETKVNYFWNMEDMKTAQFKEKASSSDKGDKFAPGKIALVAIKLLEEKGFVLKADEENAVIWVTKRDEGPWRPINAASSSFFGYIRDAMSDPQYGGDPAWTTLRQYKDVANAVVVELRVSGRIWVTNSANVNTQTVAHFKYIPLEGGKLLEWQTGLLHSWDPDCNLTYVLPVEYDPGAKCPNWERRMAEWLPDEGSRAILQEFIGYSFIPYMGFEKALVIQGEGANGKSIFLETIHSLLGYKVVDSINMRHLFSRFGQSDLVGKILNIVNEAGSEYLRGSHADDFKNLVSGGRVKADVKNLAPITFNNTAKFIFASNHDIKTGDKSEGWLRRMLIVPFEQDFRDSTVPKFQIMDELLSEKAGIFNWALEGLRRLMRNQQFSFSETSKKKHQTYMQENDISADFFANCLEIFDLTASSNEGRVVRSGTPSALINMLFGIWIEYRESTIQKKVDHITKYLERKHKLTKARTTHTLMVKKVMTECWIGLRVNIRNVGFLEHLLQEPILKYPEIKTYAETRLKELDTDSSENLAPDHRNNSLSEFPKTQSS